MLTVIQFSGKAQHGKDTTANIVKERLEAQGRKVLIAHYGDLVKYVAARFFNWDGRKDEKGREVLQRVGTDEIRDVFPNFWVDFIRKIVWVYRREWDYVLIPDCRFPNEAEAFNQIRGIESLVVRVERLNFNSPLTLEQQQHPSEVALDSFPFDYYITAESGLENLEEQVELFLRRYENDLLSDLDFFYNL